MNDKIMDKINIILYYVVAPVMVLEFLLTDLGIIAFTIPLFAGSALVLLALIAVSFFYKRKHPEYDFKANDFYTKILVVIILMECFIRQDFLIEKLPDERMCRPQGRIAGAEKRFLFVPEQFLRIKPLRTERECFRSEGLFLCLF